MIKKKIMYACLLCALLFIGCTEKAKTEISHATATPSAVGVSQNSEHDSIDISTDINTNPVDVRKEEYKHAKMLIAKKQYKEAYEILVSLNAHRDEFPKLYTLIKKVKILELGKIKKWKEYNGKNQITVAGKKVKVRIKYTSKNGKVKTANYTGKISYKQSTAYKIAIVHNGNLDYIEVGGIFGGCIGYEVYNAMVDEDDDSLYSHEGAVKRKEAEKEYQKYLEKNRTNDNEQKEIARQNETLPDPGIGMTASEVEASSWGKPKKKNITEYAWGTKEQWVYSGYRYVYLENGIVTSIQRSE